MAEGKGTPVALRDRYVIYPERPLPELNAPNAQAFMAEDRREAARSVFALISRPDLPTRTSLMRALKGIQTAGLMQLNEWGVVYWPGAGRNLMALVYDRPAGGRVMASMEAEFKRVDEYEIVRKAATPLINAMKETSQRNIVLRSIRPTNMFWMEPRDRIVLGDSALAPAAIEQPAVFETIETAMASTGGRGHGTFSDDLYALGVSLVMLMLGRNPVAGIDDYSLLQMKVAQTSYAVLVRDERLPLGMIEVLRGLLCDDPDERWTLETLDLWMSGRRLSPLQTKLDRRGARAYKFQNHDYYTCRELGMALVRHWDAGVVQVIEGRLELWLRRALEDKPRADTIAAVVRVAGDKRAAGDLALARSAMVLDPNAPIRYKTLSVLPGGFGTALAMLVAEQKEPKLWAECIMREVPKQWFENRTEYNPEWSLLDGTFKRLRNFLGQTAMGFGVERCLYDLNETMPCQSPLVVKDYVLDLKELLPALDNAAKTADPKGWPIDRHIAAFIAARADFDIDKPLSSLSDPDPSINSLAVLNLLALIQWRAGAEARPGLGAWVAGLLGPAVAGFHSKERRQRMEKEIPKVGRTGNLVELFNLLDNAGERERDAYEFMNAQSEFNTIKQELTGIETGRVGRDDSARRLGQQIAAFVSAMVAMITLTALVVMELF
ncbi:MAG: serine/threonine protein kinase [Alphaproteobacteria bacterium]|nr:serine/threonine protein kinase [Alphaproteobacteria bacterium]MBF0393969.1 serine/threonine protein kinase [Alphaproteobacteria bacterium]